MRTSTMIALIGALLVHTSARAASLVFQASPTPATSICAAPCYQLQIFYEDPTRSLDIQALQIEMSIVGALVPTIATYPSTNSNAGTGNTIRTNAAGDGLAGFPWNVTHSLNRPTYDNPPHVLLLAGASTPVDVDGLQATVDAYSASCTPVAVCAIQTEALAANRIYLGRFNFRDPSGPVSVRIGQVVGDGPGMRDPVDGVERFAYSIVPVASATPEPAPSLLLAAVVSAFVVARCRTRRVLALCAPLLTAAASNASAAPITWRIDAFVYATNTALFDHGVRIGNPVQGSLTFDPELAVQTYCDLDGGSSCTYDIPASMTLLIRDHLVEASDHAILALTSGSLENTSFTFKSQAFTYDGAAPPAMSSVVLTIAAVTTVDPRGLPTDVFPIPEIDGNIDLISVQFMVDLASPSAGFGAILASVTQAPEPSPTTLCLLALACAFGLRRRTLASRGPGPRSPHMKDTRWRTAPR